MVEMYWFQKAQTLVSENKKCNRKYSGNKLMKSNPFLSSKYGMIRSLQIPRPTADYMVPGVGKIFIEYATSGDARTASEALAGRKFSNRVVVTAFYDPELYSRQEFQWDTARDKNMTNHQIVYHLDFNWPCLFMQITQYEFKQT